MSTSDALILVVAAAAGLWLRRHAPPDLWPGGTVEGPGLAVFWVWAWTLDFFPLLIPLAPTLMILNLRRPRPPLRRLALRPGFAACLAATVGLAPGVLLQAFREVVAAMCRPGAIVRLPSPPFDTLPAAAPGTPEPMGAATNLLSRILLVPVKNGHAAAVATAVVVAWAVLAVGDRWRPQPTWLDRAGRLAGLAWIAAASILLVSVMTADFLM